MASDSFVTAAVSIAVGIIGVATLSVIVSKNSDTANVIQAATGGFAALIKAATAPVTGQSVSYSGSGTGGGYDTSGISSVLPPIGDLGNFLDIGNVFDNFNLGF